MNDRGMNQPCKEEEGEFGELLAFTFSGFASGLILGAILDHFGHQLSAIGQWIVRTLSGEGESLFEGIFAIRQRALRKAGSLAEAYGWGKLLGMMAPWGIDWASRLLGLDVYGVEGFYIPFFYAMSDQIGANVSGLLFLRRRAGSFSKAAGMYWRHPVMVASLSVILLAPSGLLAARLFGFKPDTQVLTGLETIAANLCWVPPLIGWFSEKRARSWSRRTPS